MRMSSFLISSSLALRIISAMLLFMLLHVTMYGMKLPGLAAYLVPSTVWMGIFIICASAAREGPAAGQQLLSLSFTLALFRIGFENLAGLLSKGLGLSPYGWTLLGRLLIIYYAISRILAFEASRVILIQHPSIRGSRPSLIVAVPLLYTFLTVNPYELIGHESLPGLIRYINSEFFPALADNILLTQLAYFGGLKYCIIYSATYAVYSRVTPVLPDISWTVRGLLGVAIPLLGITLLYALPSTRVFGVIPASEVITKRDVARIVAESSPLILVLLIVSGALGVKPLVVASSSMSPTLEVGDIVLVSRAESYRAGDIVAYPMKGRIIVHRVVGYLEDGSILTKGDASDEIDPWVIKPETIIGKVTFKVPKIGWVPILLKEGITYLYSQSQTLIKILTRTKMETGG